MSFMLQTKRQICINDRLQRGVVAARYSSSLFVACSCDLIYIEKIFTKSRIISFGCLRREKKLLLWWCRETGLSLPLCGMSGCMLGIRQNAMFTLEQPFLFKNVFRKSSEFYNPMMLPFSIFPLYAPTRLIRGLFLMLHRLSGTLSHTNSGHPTPFNLQIISQNLSISEALLTD